MTCRELERAFKEFKNSDDAFKLGLVYFAKAVLIEVKNYVPVNLDYLDLVEDMDRRSRGRVEEMVREMRRKMKKLGERRGTSVRMGLQRILVRFSESGRAVERVEELRRVVKEKHADEGGIRAVGPRE
ncbi:hypothetical protein C1H46_037421 [Malus baccata]|uniref:Uncharacterized protein n=1 Tax=Malus baccata TaxID=106549 RepID=A0A540KSD9_MALBA|nr:hypothetical protein C1H46_037421 [Malus baccata]